MVDSNAGKALDIKETLSAARDVQTLNDVANATADLFAGITLVGHLVGKSDKTAFFATEEREIWEIPVDALLAIASADATVPYVGGTAVSVRVKTGAKARVIRTLEIGKDVVAPQGYGEAARGCGSAPSDCNGTCCKNGWCCHPYTKCCGGGCCRP